MRCAHSLDCGAYVLGSLTPTEREAHERHLATCSGCRDQVAELAVLPGLLGRLDSATAEEIGATGAVAAPPKAPDSLLPAVLWAAQRRQAAQRRRDHWLTAAAGLVAAIFAVIVSVGVDVVRDSRAQQVPMYAMHPVTSSSVPVKAEVGLISTGQGTKIKIHCVYEGEPDHRSWSFRLYVVPRAGQAEQVGSWTARYGDDFWEDQITRHTPTDIARIELRRGDDVTLLVYEPT